MKRNRVRSGVTGLLRRWLGVSQSPAGRAGGKRRRGTLTCEHLESREVPATFHWEPVGPGNYDWADANNWDGTGYPNAAGDVVVIDSALTGNQVINLNQPITIGSLTIGTTSGAGIFTIAGNIDGGSDGALTFDVSSGSAALATANKGGGAILAPIVLADNLSVTGGSNGGATKPIGLGGNVSGTGTVTLSNTTNLLNSVSVGSGVTVAGAGTLSAVQVLYTTSYYDNAVYALDSTQARVLATLVAPDPALPDPPSGPLYQPAGLEVGPDGNLYISSQLNNQILRYNLATDQLEVFISSTVLQDIAVNVEGVDDFAPAGLRFGPDGDLYVSLNAGYQYMANSGSIYRFDVTNSGGLTYASTYTRVVDDLTEPSGLAFGVGGDSDSLYIANSVLGGIYKVADADAASDATPTTFVSSFGSGLEFPAGLNWGPDGNLYVTDLAAAFGYGQVLKFDSDGDALGEVVGPGSILFPSITEDELYKQYPSDVLFDASGNLLVVCLGPSGPSPGGGETNDYAGSIRRYSIGGTYQTYLANASMFPDIDPGYGNGASGIIPSQAVLGKVPVLTLAGALTPSGAGAAGTVTLSGVRLAFTSTADYNVNLAALGAGGVDLISSNGTVTLTGAALNVSLLGAFAPPLSSVLTIASAGTISGTFDGLANNAVISVGGQSYRINYTSTTVTLTRVS